MAKIVRQPTGPPVPRSRRQHRRDKARPTPIPMRRCRTISTRWTGRWNPNITSKMWQSIQGQTIAGLSAGYVVWIVRGGVLISSLVAQMPAWKLIDPLVVLGRFDAAAKAAEDEDEEETLQTIVDSLQEHEEETTEQPC